MAIVLSRLVDNICASREALDEHEGNRRKRTLRQLRTRLALAVADRENRELGGSAVLNVERYDEREEARVSYVIDLSTNTEAEFPLLN